ncbi:MAG: FAD-binding protein [Chloroflexia bacterium]|nr:FAD-binding protein [Chloroflexia bacterium]
MNSLSTTGIYFYFSKGTHASNLNEIIAYLDKIPNLKIIHPFDLQAFSGNDRLTKDIENKGVKKVIIAGDSPGMIKSFFAKAVAKTGGNPENIILVDFNEQGISLESAKEKAIALLLSAIYDIPYEQLIENGQLPVNQDTIVIGGGIAGIQSSLEIANAGKKVYLVEKTGTIGGHMAMFDKTFPTLDCAACILTPKW